MTVLTDTVTSVTPDTTPATSRVPHLFTPGELRQRVTDAEWNFKRRAIKIALRSARNNGVTNTAWPTLVESVDFVPTDYLPRERYQVTLGWRMYRSRVESAEDVTPETLLAQELRDGNIPPLDGLLPVESGEQGSWTIDDDVPPRRDSIVDFQRNGDYLTYNLVAEHTFTGTYEGPLMDGGLTANTLGNHLNSHYVRGGYINVEKVENLTVDDLTPPREGPGEDELDLGIFYTEDQVQEAVRARIDELKRRMAELGMEGKREHDWCGEAENTLRSIGIPDEYFGGAPSSGTPTCGVAGCDECGYEEDTEDDEPEDVTVDFVITRTITVRARRVDSAEVPDRDWVRSSIDRNDVRVEMDEDWDDVEVLNVNDDVSSVARP